MGTISLQGLKFFAHHGYYDRERDQGNHFLVDIILTTDFAKAAREDNLPGTVDYELLYEITAREMKTPSRLIENVCHRIVGAIKEEVSEITQLSVTVSKMNPPLPGTCEKASVTLSWPD